MEILFIIKGIFTIFALDVLLLAVPLEVHVQSVLTQKSSAADIAFKIFGITMFFLMVRQMALRGKRAATAFKLASEWLLAGVDSHMRLQITVFCESFFADSALKRFFSCMRSLVNLEPSRS